ncbi:MAG: ADP-ribosyl-[dinitrogen reductase] hydrolase [Pseudomonadota bacterium]
MNEAVEERAVAAYLGLAIGDALGATVEFMTPREIRAEYGVHDTIRGGGWLKLKSGEVTDDTTMALALGQSILEQGRVEALAAARAFDGWMRAKPVDIGNTVRRGILRFRQTGEACTLPNEHDGGNGACMRTLPVALATVHSDRNAVRAAALAQAHVTHNHPLSDAATVCVIEMVQAFLVGRSRAEVMHEQVYPLIEQYPPFRFRGGKPRENPSGYVVETLQTVFQCFFDTDSFADCVVETVNRGGDADTTGAIAGMLAGACFGLEAIPAPWVRALNPAVREACERQARALIRLGDRSVTKHGPP